MALMMVLRLSFIPVPVLAVFSQNMETDSGSLMATVEGVKIS